MNLHKVYAGVITAVLALAVIVGYAWSAHIRDDARRDAVIDAQKSDIADLEKKISDAQSVAQAEIAAIEKQKQQVSASPAQAPTIIREVLPELAPKPRSPEAPKNLPDTPAPQSDSSSPMLLSQKDQQDLAQFILTCKQCGVERDQLQSQVTDQQQVIDKQKTELDAAMKAAKGGSVWQRTKRVLKWGAIFGAVGYVAGRAQR